MLRITLLIAIFTGLVVARPAAAQDATPVAEGLALGTPATIYDDTGQAIGTVAVEEMVHPFEEYDLTASEPPRGYHWAMLVIRFAAGDQGLTIASGGLQLVDSTGFVAAPSTVLRSDTSRQAMPDFSATHLDPGQEATGAVFFPVYDEATPAIVEYAIGGRLVTIADLRSSRVNAGDTAVYLANDGTPLGELTVTGVLDPLSDYDPSHPPENGFRFVGISVSFTNTGSRPIVLDPSRFSVIDGTGLVTSSIAVARSVSGADALPSLPSDLIPAGSKVSGLLTFMLPSDSTVHVVIFSPASDRQIRVAEYAEGAPPSQEATPVASPVSDATPVSDCDVVIAWSQQVDTALAPTAPAFELVDQVSAGETVAPKDLRDAATAIRQASDDIANSGAPGIAVNAVEQFTTTLQSMADQIGALADAVEASDPSAIQTAVSGFYTASFGLTGGAYSDLATRCPGLNHG